MSNRVTAAERRTINFEAMRIVKRRWSNPDTVDVELVTDSLISEFGISYDRARAAAARAVRVWRGELVKRQR